MASLLALVFGWKTRRPHRPEFGTSATFALKRAEEPVRMSEVNRAMRQTIDFNRDTIKVALHTSEPLNHSCEMTFPDKECPMAWWFVCPCGYETGDAYEALAHTGYNADLN